MPAGNAEGKVAAQPISMGKIEERGMQGAEVDVCRLVSGLRALAFEAVLQGAVVLAVRHWFGGHGSFRARAAKGADHLIQLGDQQNGER
jgi:hypothetical protein